MRSPVLTSKPARTKGTNADAILGALLVAVIGTWSRGGDPSDAEVQAAVLDQVVAGLRPHER